MPSPATDIVMPNQEGIQTITEMRTTKPDAKTIAVSSGGRIGDTDFLRIAQVLGAMAAVAKPFDGNELQILVKDCLVGAP